MGGYVAVCSGQWKFIGAAGNQRPVCSGIIQSVPVNELNATALSAEDWAEFQGHALLLFAVVFCVLALKKALS